MEYLDKLKNLRTQREMSPVKISDEVLRNAIEHVRLGSTAKNAQPLRFALINNEAEVKAIYEGTNLPTVHKITEDKMPSAFIVIGLNKEFNQNNLLGIDIGISVQIIREYLYEHDLASVCIYSFNRIDTKKIINNDKFNPECLIAIGKSNQVVHIADSEDNVENYRNDNNEHTTRKLVTDSLIVKRSEVK